MNILDPKKLHDLAFIQFNRRMILRGEERTKNEISKDVLIATND